MRRRARGEGSIFERADGRWVAQVSYREGGQRRRRYAYASTQAEARRALTQLQTQNDSGVSLSAPRGSVEAYLAQWIAVKQRTLRPESARRYGDMIRLHLVPSLGRIKLADLTATDVEALISRLRDAGLSNTTVSMAHGVLHKALNDAVKQRKLTTNVSHRGYLVDAPKRGAPSPQTLTPDQATRLHAAAKGDELEAFYLLALTTGMRLGELQALRWDAVDLGPRPHVQVVATYGGTSVGEPVFGEPKTAGSRRNVRVSTVVADSLRRHRAAQIERRLMVGQHWQDYGLVFTTSKGRPLDGNNLRTRSFARLLERAELPPMRFHTLRHAAATLLMAEGVPIKVISEMLGHSDVTTTLRIYAHALPTAQDQAAAVWDRLYGDDTRGAIS